MSIAAATTLNPAQLDRLSVDTIRFLSVDAVQKTYSGHPGLPLGAAPMAYVLWTRFLQHNWSGHFSPRDSAAPSLTGFVWPKSRDWKAGRQEHEKQSFETIGNARED